MEVRIRTTPEGEFYAESGDEFSTFHQTPARSSIEEAKADALAAYSTGEEEFREPSEDEEYSPDIILVNSEHSATRFNA